MLRALSLLVFLRALSLIGGEILASGGDLRAAQDVDPVSFDIRQAQVEVLLRMKHLEEAVLVSRDAWVLFRGNAQAQAAYATALVMYTTHEDDEGSPFTVRDALEQSLVAIDRDPSSVAAIDRLMFLLAARGMDLDLFQTLGVHRAKVSGLPGVEMKCRLCGRHWLEHRQKYARSSNPK